MPNYPPIPANPHGEMLAKVAPEGREGRIRNHERLEVEAAISNKQDRICSCRN